MQPFMKIPESHPRYQSLMTREKIVEGIKAAIVAPEGLIATAEERLSIT